MPLPEGIPLATKPNNPCCDIRKEQLEKTVPYAQALQDWVEKSNSPMLDQPHLLVRCILKLRRMMEPYVSFSNDAVLDGVTPQKGFLEDQTRVAIPRNTQPASTSTPLKRSLQRGQHLWRSPSKRQPHWGPLEGLTNLAVTVGKLAEELTPPQVQYEEQTKVESSPNQFPGWKKVLHPSWLATAIGQTPQPLVGQDEDTAARVLGEESSMPKGRRMLLCKAVCSTWNV